MMDKISFKFRVFLYKLFNRGKYNKLEGNIIRPLKIQGKKYISIHRGVIIHDGNWLGAYKIGESDPQLVFEEGACIGHFNHFSCASKISIGKKVLTADKVFITDNTHSFEDVSLAVMDQAVKVIKPVNIGEGAWIGENVSIIGASVGKNSIIGSNSVVTRDIPDYSIAVGNPARVIKKFNFESKSWEKV